MTRLPWLSRRKLMQNSALSASVPIPSKKFTKEDVSLPAIDSVAAYLGIPLFSYESVAGELWYRIVDPDPNCSDDCIYRVEQNIAAQDGDISNLSYDPPAVIDASFEFRVFPSVSPEQPPAAYQQFTAMFDPSVPDDQTEAGVTTSERSVGQYPGLQHTQDAMLTGDDVSVLVYTQTLPWGIIHWNIAYGSGMEVTVQTDKHQAWLHQRLHRDQDWPSMAPSRHWADLHDGSRAEKGRYRGDIQPILSEADDADINRSKLQQVEGTLSSSSAVDTDAAISFTDNQ